jgi:hypothetical protein
MLPVGFESTIPVSERPQTYALDRAATGIGILIQANVNISATGYVHCCSPHKQCVNLKVRHPFIHVSFGLRDIKLLLLVEARSSVLRFGDVGRN